MVSLPPPTFPLPASLGHLLQVDSILFAEFQAWKESPTLEKSCSFLDRIYQEDVGPCLDFTKQEVSAGKGRQRLHGLAAPKLHLYGGDLCTFISALVSLCRSCRSWYEWLWSRIRSPSSRLLPRHCLW